MSSCAAVQRAAPSSWFTSLPYFFMTTAYSQPVRQALMLASSCVPHKRLWQFTGGDVSADCNLQEDKKENIIKERTNIKDEGTNRDETRRDEMKGDEMRQKRKTSTKNPI